MVMWTTWMQNLGQDVRYGSRMIARNPGFAAVVILTLALGIGLNTSIFSAVNAALLRPLPYPQPDRLVQIKRELTGQKRRQMTDWLGFDEVSAWNRASPSLPVTVAAHTWLYGNLTGQDGPVRVTCGCVSESLLRVLGALPVLGRNFMPEEDRAGGPPVVILSHGLWQRQYGGDRQILNRTVRLEQKSYTVVGVLPPDLHLPEPYDLLLPMAVGRQNGREEHLGSPRALGRLKTGATLSQAQASLDALYQSVRDPAEPSRIVLADLQAEMARGVKRPLLTFLGAAGFVLLIACANAASLLLARAANRQREIALRSALGAGRGRVIQQLLTESVLLASAGGILGVFLALWSARFLPILLPDWPAGQVLRLDVWVLGFSAALSLVTSLLFGLVPALAVSKVSAYDTLKAGSHSLTAGRRQHRLGNLLVMTEVALAMVLMLGAGLLLNSFLRLQSVDPGFQPDRRLSFTIDLAVPKYPHPSSQGAYFRQVLDRLGALPGVEAVGANSMLPFTQAGVLFNSFEVAGPAKGGEQPMVALASINGDYFRAMGIPLLRGRTFTEADRAGAPEVVVISENLARRCFPNEDPIGKQIKTGGHTAWQTIVGVVGDIHLFDLESWEQNQVPHLYRSYLQAGNPLMSLVVKTAGPPLALTEIVKSQVANVDQDQPLYSLMTLEQRLAGTLAHRRSNLLLLAVFALMALGLALAGIYGVISYAVTQRTQEIGVRMALGASRRAVLGLILRHGLWLAGVGVMAGLLGGLGLTRLIASQLYDIPANDPATFAMVALLLVLVAALASWIPARRATHIDPMAALRRE